jgi:hypothetical protein
MIFHLLPITAAFSNTTRVVFLSPFYSYLMTGAFVFRKYGTRKHQPKEKVRSS